MDSTAQSLVLYDFPLSGHCHRVRLMLSLLGLPYRSILVDLPAREQKGPAFLALNPFGQIPVLRDGELTIADSNAILVYLASKYGAESWFPRDPRGAAAVQRWLSIAAGELVRGPVTARALAVFKRPGDPSAARSIAEQLFAQMNEHLQHTTFLAGGVPTIADVACYTYVARAPEGGIALEPFEHLRAWLARIEALPGFVAMPHAPGR
jgi:glutathione S-transferase